VSEILFYHLDRRPLEQVLPVLLEKSLERGWRAVVHAGSSERAAALDNALWTYRDDSFLPHGRAEDPDAPRQPIIIAADDVNPNGATVRFVVDGAPVGDAAAFQRVVILFDGRDEDALAQAREQWKSAKSAGHDVTYWQQAASGAWEKKG
jgi:DNA polymerase-3 subunit chi